MSEWAVEWLDLCGEGLSRAVLGVWNEILVGLQQFRAPAYRWQVLDPFPKDLSI